MKHDDPFSTPPEKDGESKAANVPSQLSGDTTIPSLEAEQASRSESPSKQSDPFTDEAGETERTAEQPLASPSSVLDACLAVSSAAAVEAPFSVFDESDLAKITNEPSQNALYTAATSLFVLINQLRGSSALIEIADLRERVVTAVNNFEQRALSAGYSKAIVQTAQYCLCTAIDEAALNTEWGINSAWSRQTLLYSFFNDTSGGEKFFVNLDQVKTTITNSSGDEIVRAQVDLLEILYICLALGFYGKYRILDQGTARLKEQRNAVYELIKKQRAALDYELSPNWISTEVVHQQRDCPPVWLTVLTTLVVLLSIYLTLSYSLNVRSDQAFAKVQPIGRTVSFQFDRAMPTVEKAKEWWRGFDKLLKDEINRNILEVIDMKDAIVIRVFNNGLFGSASAAISDDFQQVFRRISDAIEARVPGAVTVIGHSDNQPIRNSVRFPSNWHLSTARAQAVANAVIYSLSKPDRVSFEGRSDTEPLTSNDTPEGRATNRRVEIFLPKVVPMADAMPTPSNDKQTDGR